MYKFSKIFKRKKYDPQYYLNISKSIQELDQRIAEIAQQKSNLKN